MELNKILAKSTGISVITHSQNVGRLAKLIATKTLRDQDHSCIRAAEYAGLLHDIGKMTKGFQNVLSGKGKKTGNEFRHNEIGFAFLHTYLTGFTDNIRKLITNSVYYHHGIFFDKKMGVDKPHEIIKTVSNEDILSMKKLLIDLIGEQYLLSDNNTISNRNDTTPVYFQKEMDENDNENSYLMIVRSSLISADRIISELESVDGKRDLYTETELETEYTNRHNRHGDPININNVSCPHNGINALERFSTQKKIVTAINDAHTTIVNAPSGFGKTLIGILWALLNKQKIFWVCPRNEIAIDAYRSILSELNALGLAHIRVELFLTNEVKAHNSGSDILLSDYEAFSADIVVTNIDNFERPTIDGGKKSEHIFLMNSTLVVFDEFHELESELPLFALFVNIMKVRHRLANTKTILLSATGMNISFLWDTVDNITQYLPKLNTHYQAAHTKPYQIHVYKDINLSTLQINVNDSLFLYNSKTGAQLTFMENSHNQPLLSHGQFEKDVMASKRVNLLEQYGKNAQRINGRPNVISNRIINTGLDISFKELYESILSPSSCLQGIGRTNRYGEYDLAHVHFFLHSADETIATSEMHVRNILYKPELTRLWFDFLNQFNNKTYTLDEMYKHIFNRFKIDNEVKIKEYVRTLFEKSADQLSKIYPKKYPSKQKKKSSRKRANSNALRSSKDTWGYFIIMDKFNGGLSEVFQTELFSHFDVDCDEDGQIFSKMRKKWTAESKRQSNNELDYDKLIKTKNIDIYRRMAECNDTPYMRFDLLYHPELGVVKKKFIQE